MKRIVVFVVSLALLVGGAVPANADLWESSGHVNLLRVHDVGTGYGPPGDYIDVEVIVWLDSKPGMAFGFQLRDDSNRLARQGMLDLLREAFSHNDIVTIDYNITPGKNNGVITRVWITKPSPDFHPVNKKLAD
ncbi:MAG: hypothetical protein WB607_08885 [Candidatus Acidiferrum sp.]|jgi:hypothetical protein